MSGQKSPSPSPTKGDFLTYHRADIVVDENVVVEVKSTQVLPPFTRRQVINSCEQPNSKLLSSCTLAPRQNSIASSVPIGELRGNQLFFARIRDQNSQGLLKRTESSERAARLSLSLRRGESSRRSGLSRRQMFASAIQRVLEGDVDLALAQLLIRG